MTELYVALDVATLEEALELGRRLAPVVDGFKVGLELLLGTGPSVVATVAELGRPVFADAKLHDIPNTVEAAARQLGKAGARFVSVHATGGRHMIESALVGFGAPGVLAVTILTSLDDTEQQAANLAGLAASAGAEGVVCSVIDLSEVKQAAPGLLYVCPGIRTVSADDDQRRVATPAEAKEAGADIIIVGRPITRSNDPVRAAQAVTRVLA
jgi:orotidine-5'-phosphate decarboxylase